LILLYQRLTEAVVPTKAFYTDAGYDLVATHNAVVWPHTVCNLDTGWDVKVPAGFWGSIKTRSSTFKRRKLLVLEGVIDSGYTGPLGVLVFNPTFIPKFIKKGERLAQLIILPMSIHLFEIVQQMPVTDRGPNGFGATGR